MNEQGEKRALELFEELREMPPGQRAAALRRETADDLELAAAVERLLALDSVQDSFLMRPMTAPGMLRDALAAAEEGERRAERPSNAAHPESIGPYRILGVVGEGGMGVVYRAWQPAPPRVVALKILRPGLCGAREQRRFDDEARALGRLEHANIAWIFDHGAADFGRGEAPYLVMEYVDGRDLLTYANEQSCDDRTRVSLLVRTARAVHHAHQRSVIHRDLKPKNVLVTQGGEPKVVDFGLARLEDTDLTAASNSADAGRLLGTLAYMSPEQLDPRGEVDTRTDVYGLGATLYELLSGAPVFDLRGLEFPAALMKLANERPAPLRAAAPHIDRDLAAIVEKAMRPERAERYGSAEALADDLERWMRGEPVVARPVGAWTRMWKAARRSPWLTVTSTAAVLAVLVGAAATTWQAHRAQLALQAHREQEHHTKEVLSFLDRALRSAGEPRTDGEELRAAHVLDFAARDIQAAFPDQPLTRARVSATVGSTLYYQARYPLARDMLERALAEMLEELGPNDPETLSAQHDLGLVMTALSEPERAEQCFRSAVEGRVALLGEAHPQTQASVQALGQLLLQRGELTQAEQAFSRLLELRRVTLGAHAPETLAALHGLAQAWRRQGKTAQAERELRRVVAELRGMPQAEPFTLYETLNTLGVLMIERGEFEEASECLREALAGYTARRGSAHPDTRVLAENLRVVEAQRGKAGEDVPSRAVERTSPLAHAVAINMANQAFYRGEFDRAETGLWAAIDGLEQIGGQEHYAAQGRLCVAAVLLARADQVDGQLRSHDGTGAGVERLACLEHALSLQEEIIERHRTAGTLEGGFALIAQVNRAESLRRLGRLDESLAELERLVPKLAESAGNKALYTLSARIGLAAALADLNRLEESLEHSQSALAAAQRNWEDPNAYTEMFRVRRAVTLSALGRHAEAAPELLCAHERLVTLFGENGHYTQRAAVALAQLYAAWELPTHAALWRDRSGSRGVPVEASSLPGRRAGDAREGVVAK